MLLNAIGDGLGLLTWDLDSFALADSYDEAAGRYGGLQPGARLRSITDSDSSRLLVKPEVAIHQLDAEVPGPGPVTPPTPGGPPSKDVVRPGAAPKTGPDPASPQRLVRYHGSVALDPARAGRDAGRIAEEVIAHLAGLDGASVTVTLEIAAEIPAGAPDHVVRIVTENSRSLKFSTQGFEGE